MTIHSIFLVSSILTQHLVLFLAFTFKVLLFLSEYDFLRHSHAFSYWKSNDIVDTSVDLLNKQHAAHTLNSVATSLIRTFTSLDIRLNHIIRKTLRFTQEVHLGLFCVGVDDIARMSRVFSWGDNYNRRQDLVHSLVSQMLEHANVISFTSRLLQNSTILGNDNSVRSDDEIRIRYRFQMNFKCGSINVHTLLVSSCSYILVRT